jgi:hypothetical protein
MLKEILKGSKINLKGENKIKNNNSKAKDKDKRINSVLNNFLLFRKLNLAKRTKQNRFENLKSLIINKKNANSSQKLTDTKKSNITLTDSEKSNNRNLYYNKSSFRTNYSYNLKSKKDLSRDISTANIINFDEKVNTLGNSFDKFTNTIKYDDKYINEKENENGCGKKRNIFLKNVDNTLFIKNLEKEFEIRYLQKKIEKLKNGNKSLTQKLNEIRKKNYLLKNETIKEQNKRKKIICSTINICNKYSEKNVYEEESDFKNLLLNIMDKKYNYDNLKLNNFFFNSIKELLLCSNIFNASKSLNNNNIYQNINNLIRLKNKFITKIKEYNESNKNNEKYYNYCSDLFKYFNTNDLETLYKNLAKIKSNNDDETQKIIKMKNVLFNEDKIGKRRINIRSSENNLNCKKNAINFNYADLQKYFIESNKKNNLRTNSTKASSLSIKTEKANNFNGCLTDRISPINDNEFEKYKTTRSNYEKINYYTKTREQLKYYKLNYSGKNLHQINSFNYRDKKKINTDEESEKDSNLLYYSYKHKLRNIPHNYRTFKRIEIHKKVNGSTKSTNNLISFNKNGLKRKTINRIKQFKLNLLNNNKLSSSNFQLYKKYKDLENIQRNEIEIENDNRKNETIPLNMKSGIEKNNTYNNVIENKKKTLNLIIPSLKSVKNYRTIIFNGK